MNRQTLIGGLRKLWHADGQILDLRARRLGFRIVLISLAIVIAGISASTAALGIYALLSGVFGQVLAAAILSASSLALAVALLAVASRRPYAEQLRSAEQDHAQAFEALRSEIQRFDIYDPQQRTPLVETILPMIAPLISALVVEGLRQRRENEVDSSEVPEQKG